jgi:uncharacterized membrane protein YozB (DUF420 family)
MATLANRTLSPARRDRLFFTGMALALTAFVFAGFAPTYYLVRVLHGTTISGNADGAGLTPLLHLHALVNSAWMLALVAQTGLVSAHRTDLHRRIGPFAAGLIPAVLIVGLWTAINAGQLHHGPPGRNFRAFLMFPFSAAIGFAILAGLAVWWRKQAGAHKRLMILATIAATLPAGVRIANMAPAWALPHGPPGGMILSNLFLAALVAFDLVSLRRLHPATIWGGGALLASEPLRIAISETRVWQSFAALLIG